MTVVYPNHHLLDTLTMREADREKEREWPDSNGGQCHETTSAHQRHISIWAAITTQNN